MMRKLSYKEAKTFVQSYRAKGTEYRCRPGQWSSIGPDLNCVIPALKRFLMWPLAPSPRSLFNFHLRGFHSTHLRYHDFPSLLLVLPPNPALPVNSLSPFRFQLPVSSSRRSFVTAQDLESFSHSTMQFSS